ncbi:MAG TPA: MoxR family ATPase [Cerasibacillus sp.]|uniref:AAA family ATPase n=1 Tax=Cerasibacillus sp. TaxID=2498711 RepID=UPI002F40856E
MKKIHKAKQALQQVIYGKETEIDLLFIAIIAGGHILFESAPGTGKTKLAKSFAKVMHGDFNRVQFTPDVLPSDVTGIRYFNPKHETFELREGPVVTNVLLADEINRATPKTQSSLLEVMEEHQVTIDGETVTVPQPFIVLATQNPVESNYGTFPLPEAQLDRFLFKINLGYPTREEEKEILQNYRLQDPYNELEVILEPEDILELRRQAKEVVLTDIVTDYLLDIVHETRTHSEIELGISPRGVLALMRAAQAKALVEEREYITPQDIKTLASYVFPHRLILTMEGAIKKTVDDIVGQILNQIPVPVENVMN